MKAAGVGAYQMIESAITDQQCLLLDGGVATELSHQHGQDHERLWGIETLASAPDEVYAVHRRYVDARVDVITTNTWSLPSVLEGETSIQGEQRRPVHWMEIARRGVQVARRAIADGGQTDEIAVAFSLNGDIDAADARETIALLARTLASDPPDLILLETLSVLRFSLFEVIDALLSTELPVWLSFRRCPHGLCGVYGQHWGGPEGDAFGRAARRFEEMGVSALLVNCIPPDHVDGMVSYLRDFTDLPLGVYPNLGYYTSAGWQTETEIGGPEYAEMALRWRGEGAQIIGGCCGTRPEHIAAARDVLEGTLPGRERHQQREDLPDSRAMTPPTARHTWSDRRGRPLFPLAFPQITKHPDVSPPIPGSFLLWRYLFETNVGAQQRCLDIGSGTGLQTVQLALNGAAHVHAIDVDGQAVANTLDNAFRNGVAERVTASVGDIFPWVPSERYEVVVANLPQMPVDPLSRLFSHRPLDYWGRGLVDQVIAKLPRALATEGSALLTLTSLLSPDRTLDMIANGGLCAEVVAWDLQELPEQLVAHSEHLAHVEQLSDAYRLHIGEADVLVNYVIEIRHASAGSRRAESPWS